MYESTLTEDLFPYNARAINSPA